MTEFETFLQDIVQGCHLVGAEKRRFHFVNSFFVCWIKLLVFSKIVFSIYLPKIYRSTLYKIKVGNRLKYSPTQLTTLQLFPSDERKLHCYRSSGIKKLNRILKPLASSFAESTVYWSSLISKVLKRNLVCYQWFLVMYCEHTESPLWWPHSRPVTGLVWKHCHFCNEREIFSFIFNKSEM